MYTGTITFVSGKGWFFAERDGDSAAIFIHQRDVENRRYLKIDDRVEFDVDTSPRHPDKICAVNVKYIGHIVARQMSAERAERVAGVHP